MRRSGECSETAVAEYTVLASAAVVAVVAVEVVWLRTGLLRRPAYAIT